VVQFRQWHVESPPWAQELFVVCWQTRDFTNPPRKKSHGVKSHDLGGQFWSPLRGMTRPGYFSRNNSVVSRAVWQIAPSCWKHILPYLYHPTEATKTPLSCCDNVRHSLLLHFRAHFRKSTAQSLRQPKFRTKQWLVVHAMAFNESLEDSPRPKSDSFVCSRTHQVESVPHC
jgi:hypothetical protein